MTGAAVRDLNVLVVDDLRTMTRVLRGALATVGITRVEEASDVPTALDRLRRNPVDLVISDWNMEPMTGLDLLHAIRADAALAATRFILVTADATNARTLRTRNEAVDAFLMKPFDSGELREAIGEAMA